MMNSRRLKRLLAFCAAGIVLIFAASGLQAQNIALSGNSPDTYTVKEGDTLWDIAAVFLDAPWLWPEVWQINPEIENPDLIYPGDVLNLVYVDGRPRIMLERGSRETVRLSPLVRELPLLSPIPAIPHQVLDSFLVQNRIVDMQIFESSPYIVASAAGNLVMGAGHEVYARGEWTDNFRSYEVFRLGTRYVDVMTGDLLGQEVINLGAVNIIADEGNGMKKALIVGSSAELKAGDRLLPTELSPIDASFFPTTPQTPLNGKVIGLLDAEAQAAQFESVVIDLGTSNGLAVGDLLTISQTGDSIKDPITNDSVQLPGAEIGILMAYRTFEKLSYGVILSLTQPAAKGDTVSTP